MNAFCSVSVNTTFWIIQQKASKLLLYYVLFDISYCLKDFQCQLTGGFQRELTGGFQRELTGDFQCELTGDFQCELTGDSV